jgi:ABC-type Fe3+/spermidine/putrescine transport system ATPase subunit
MSSILTVRKLVKRYGAKTVVEDLDLEIRAGEIFTFLGPSGCGKTTTLRIIAGLEPGDAGEVVFDGRIWMSGRERIVVPPHKREIGMVFQSYAIWPHMTVFENVAYPLRVQGKPTTRVREILELVRMGEFADRPAPALSGGQQQRVALARALASEPRILLLDEPFSNLDAHLRHEMRFELKRIQRSLGVTVLLVTHDQLDAFSLSDRIGVMRAGRFEQIDDGLSLYERPRTPFVRDFIGRNLVVPGEVARRHDASIDVRLSSGGILRLPEQAAAAGLSIGTRVSVSTRYEDAMVIKRGGEALMEGDLHGKVDAVLFVGNRYECEVALAGGTVVTASLPRSMRLVEGDQVAVRIDPQLARIWPAA